MKKLCMLLTAILLLTACTQVTNTPEAEKPNVFVVNSAWKIVKEATLSRAIESLDTLEAEVAAYNSANSDDQLVIFEGDVPPVELAPEASLCLIYSDNNEVYADEIVIRADLEERRAVYREEVKRLHFNSGRPTALYVDNAAPIYTPPYVEPVDNRTDYEKYSIYIVQDSDGAIMFEEHCNESQDPSDPAPLSDYFSARVNGIQLSMATNYPGCTLITGRIYTVPVDEPEV